MRTSRLTVAVVASTALALAGAAGASAQTPSAAKASKAPKVVTLTDRVLAPFQLAVRDGYIVHDGSVWVADGGTGKVSRIRSNGSLATIASFTGKDTDVAGLAWSRSGRTLAWTSTDHAKEESWLNLTRSDVGTVRYSLSDYEKSANPDGDAHYGIKNPTQCQIDAFKKLGQGAPPASYTGIKDSHPYSVVHWGDYWVVADAGGNDLVKVDAQGKISTVAVLPPQPVKITKAAAAANKLPSCLVGATYAFEPVPTDVEVGPHGLLYVTTLPGGPEDPSLGARGSVYVVNGYTGQSVRIATGFAGATNLALVGRTIYVTELFGGRISTVSHGKPRPYLSLPGALSVEYGHGHLYAGTLAPMDPKTGKPTGKGRVVEIRR
jgi:sugar lactone lactonase YvrE